MSHLMHHISSCLIVKIMVVHHVHILHVLYYLIGGEVSAASIELDLNYPLDKKCSVACHEVSDYSVVSSVIYWSCLEICIKDSESVFYSISLGINPDDFFSVIFCIKIGSYCIESVKLLLFFYLLLIDREVMLFAFQFSSVCRGRCFSLLHMQMVGQKI